MKLRQMFHEFEAGAEFIVQRTGAIADNFETTAPGWAFRTKGCNDDVATGPNGIRDLAHVPRTLIGIGQEMKNSSVVPSVIFVPCERKRRHIAAQPVHICRFASKTLFCHCQRSRRNIKNR